MLYKVCQHVTQICLHVIFLSQHAKNYMYVETFMQYNLVNVRGK